MVLQNFWEQAFIIMKSLMKDKIFAESKQFEQQNPFDQE